MDNGVFTGYEDGSFRGADAITREQLAAVLTRFCDSLPARNPAGNMYVALAFSVNVYYTRYR